MFHTPKKFSSHLNNYLPYQEGVKIINNLNKILRDTAFPNKAWNPFFLICTSLSCFSIIFSLYLLFTRSHDDTFSVGSFLGGICGGIVLPYLVYFVLMIYKKYSRKRCLLRFIDKWNKEQQDGVFISLGGGGTTARGVAVGSETGGTYEHFYMATCDHKGIFIRGYLHVFVNYPKYAHWCRITELPFIPPNLHQQPVAPQHHQQAEHDHAQEQHQLPPGHVLVAMGQDQNQTPDYNQTKQL